jgi:hypothetical protein
MTENPTDFLKLLNRQEETLARLEEMVSRMAEQLEQINGRQKRLIKKMEDSSKDLDFLARDSVFFADDFKEGYHEWEMGRFNSGSLFYIGVIGTKSIWSL